MNGRNVNHRIKDGREIVVRVPKTAGDMEPLYKFFNDLPAGIQRYLRYNQRDHAFLERRLNQIDGVEHWRLIAELDGKIVADGTLDREPFGWTRHVAQLRCIVAPENQHLGISSIVCLELVAMGTKGGIEMLFTELLAEQTDMIEAVKKAGFVHEVTRKRYAKAQDGRLHDVLIFSNNLDEIWNSLSEHIHRLDEPRDYSGEY